MKNVRNQVQLIGRMGKDPEMLNTQSGKTKATLALAVNHSYTNAIGQKIENTQWFRIIAWGGTAELMEKMLVKGSEVIIQGKLDSHSYETKKGETAYITQVVADSFLLLQHSKSKVLEHN